MTEEELRATVASEIQNSLGYIGNDLTEDRRRAIEYYLGEPFGDEVEGQSQVVSHDVADTIEWMLPSLLKIFTSSDKAVEFEPQGIEDEEGAKQETDTTNYVFYKENNGFLNLYTWFKDALLQKNGIIKVYWDDHKEVKREEYKGLTEMQLLELADEDGVEVIEHEEKSEDVEGFEVLTYDVAIKRTTPGTVVQPIPPEEFLHARRHNSIDIKTIDFCAHRRKRTISDLREDGYTDLDDLGGYGEGDYNEERITRFEEEWSLASESLDESMREVWVSECFMKVDYDGDGIAELRKVTVAGDQAYKILDNELIDEIPFRAITPVIMTHRFTGISVADQVMDLQKIKSVLLRQILDNLYLQNNPRNTVVEGQVNLDDLLTNRSGGIVRQKQPGMVDTLSITPLSGHAFGMLEQLESIKENRTGVTRYNQGLDANSLNKTAHGIDQIMSASQERIKLIARIFAETGVKGLFLDIHRLEQTHNTRKKAIKLRNKWVEVSPTEWKHRTNMTINVGLGTGEKEKTTQQAMMIMGLQKELLTMGRDHMVPDEKIYSALEKMVDTTDFKSVESFFADPKTTEKPKPKPSPELLKMQADQQESQMKAKMEQQKLQLQQQLEASKMELETAKMELDRFRIESDVQIKRAELVLRKDIELMKQESELIRIQSQNTQSENKIALQEREAEINAAIKERELELEKMRQDVDKEVGVAQASQTPSVNVTIEKDGKKKIKLNKREGGYDAEVESE